MRNLFDLIFGVKEFFFAFLVIVLLIICSIVFAYNWGYSSGQASIETKHTISEPQIPRLQIIKFIGHQTHDGSYRVRIDWEGFNSDIKLFAEIYDKADWKSETGWRVVQRVAKIELPIDSESAFFDLDIEVTGVLKEPVANLRFEYGDNFVRTSHEFVNMKVFRFDP